MFTMIVSVLWVISSTISLAFKAFLMNCTKQDINKAENQVERARQQLEGARLGNKIFFFGSIFGFAVLALAYFIGLIKIWVVIVDCVIFVIGLIMNILFLGYLKKRASK